MIKRTLLLSISISTLMLAGCEQQETRSTPASSAASPDTHEHADGSTHAAHAENPQATQAPSSAHGGNVTELGQQEVNGFTVKAGLEGSLVSGQDAVFLVKTTPDTDALRVWIGDDQATNSVRSKAEGGPSDFHAHTPVPSPMGDDAQLWVEVQSEDGERGSVSFDLVKSPSSSENAHYHGSDSHSHDSGDAAHEHAPSPTPVAQPEAHSHGGGSAHSH